MIHVCSLARLHATVEETGARHIVTLINDETLVLRPECIAAENHLFLGMHDIPAEMHGFRAPGQSARAGAYYFRAALGPQHAAGGALLRRHQPFDGGGLYDRMRAQSAAR